MNSSTKYKLEKQNSYESIRYFLMYKRKLKYMFIFSYIFMETLEEYIKIFGIWRCAWGPETRCKTYFIDEFCVCL